MQQQLPPIPFFFKNHEIRAVLLEDDSIWFVAKDVCGALCIVWKGSETLVKIPEAWRVVRKFHTTQKNQYGTCGKTVKELILINEAALYKLTFRSNKSDADEFTNWIASEVMPAIRKTGTYSVHQPDHPFDFFTPELLHLMITEIVQKTSADSLSVLTRGINGIRGNLRHIRSDLLQTRLFMKKLCRDVASIKESVPSLSSETDRSDPESAFVSEMCDLAPRSRTPKDTLYAAYTEYCETHGLHAVCKNYFFKRLYEISGFLKSSTTTIGAKRIPIVKGIALKKR